MTWRSGMVREGMGTCVSLCPRSPAGRHSARLSSGTGRSATGGPTGHFRGGYGGRRLDPPERTVSAPFPAHIGGGFGRNPAFASPACSARQSARLSCIPQTPVLCSCVSSLHVVRNQFLIPQQTARRARALTCLSDIPLFSQVRVRNRDRAGERWELHARNTI
mgnify:CR=1 FL=1